MNKIFIFGKPGGGKSSLSKSVSAMTGIDGYALDLIQYRSNGEPVSSAAFKQEHADLISLDSWVIEGFGTVDSFWLTVGAADTLVYLDLPYSVHYWWVTKRLLKSFLVKPEGWPEGSSVLKGTLASWKHLRLSPRFWTPELLEKIQACSKEKAIHRLTSVKQMNNFLNQIDHAE